MDSRAAMGVMLGPQEMVARSLLAYQRVEEQAADRSAVRYLTATGQSPRGLLETLKRFQSEALFKSAAVDPYLQSHPMPAERISLLERAARAAPTWKATDSPALQARHDMARAKLFAFLGNSSEVSRRYPLSDTSLAARYARAIQAYRFGRQADALAQIDALIAAQPHNPYFYELKGQALLEAGRAHESIPLLRKAAGMAPHGVPIRVMLGHALVAANDPRDLNEAVRILSSAAIRDDDNAEAYQYLAMAYDRKGDRPMAQLSAAEALFQQGRFVEARTQAHRAQEKFKRGSRGWLKADDILNYRPPKLN
jgi:predicted Zn-dependent protease